VSVAGVVLAHYTVGDRMAEAHAMVSLVEQGWASQKAVARAFGCTSRTVRREREVPSDAGASLLKIIIGVKVDLLVLECAPETLPILTTPLKKPFCLAGLEGRT